METCPRVATLSELRQVSSGPLQPGSAGGPHALGFAHGRHPDDPQPAWTRATTTTTFGDCNEEVNSSG